MANEDRTGRQTLTRIALILVGLFVAAIVVSILLRLVKIIVFAGLLAVGALVVIRALRARR